MHGLDDMQFADSLMVMFARAQRFGDDADDLTSRRAGRIGDHAHQPDGAAAIDEADAALRQQGTELLCRLAIDRQPPRRGTEEDADPHPPVSLGVGHAQDRRSGTDSASSTISSLAPTDSQGKTNQRLSLSRSIMLAQ